MCLGVCFEGRSMNDNDRGICMELESQQRISRQLNLRVGEERFTGRMKNYIYRAEWKWRAGVGRERTITVYREKGTGVRICIEHQEAQVARIGECKRPMN